MPKRYIGLDEPRNYTDEGVKDNPCVAVICSMIGAGSIEACHSALVAAGISEENGSTLPIEERTVVLIGETGDKVTLGAADGAYNANEFFSKAEESFLGGKGQVLLVPKNPADPESFEGHWLLAAGQRNGEGEVDDFLIGDSMLNGMQMVRPEELAGQIATTIDSFGVLYHFEISVEHATAN